MVKGVNKRVIEVNDTGSKFFEKIVFYVTPQYSELTPAQLKEATKFLYLGPEGRPNRTPLRKRHLRKKRVAFWSGLVLVLIGVAVFLILK
jgi:hypothetical protein